jgi:hypothetical protein
MFQPKAGDGSASFIAVQVAKLQEQEQALLDATVERNDKWCREIGPSNVCKDAIPQDGFSQHGFRGITAKKFFELHAASPFDDTALAYKGLWWHATPIGGVSSSSENPDRYSWNLDMFTQFPDRALLSNRLYGFKFTSRDYSEVGFNVKIYGTEEVALRIMSPLWSDGPAQYVLKIRRQ